MQQKVVNSARTVHIDTHAAATLRYIRSSMEAAASLAVPGSAGVAMGIVGLLASVISSTPNWHQHWLGIWLAAAVVAAGLGGTLMTRQSSLRGLTFAGTPLRKFALCLLPALFGGAVMTAVHWSYGNLHAIPGTWLLFYGCALHSAGFFMTRGIKWLGWIFISGAALFVLLAYAMQWRDGPLSPHWIMGVFFGGLQLVYGVYLYFTEKKNPAA